MELIDVIDENETVIDTVSRKEIYTQKLTHAIVHVLLFKDGKILLQQRAKDKLYAPLHWTSSSAGHVQSGESCEQAAMRETKEELGLSVSVELLGTTWYESDSHKIIIYVYTGSYESEIVTNHEVAEVALFSVEQITQLLSTGTVDPQIVFLFKKYPNILKAMTL